MDVRTEQHLEGSLLFTGRMVLIPLENKTGMYYL